MATPVIPSSETVDTSRYDFVQGRLIERALPEIPHAKLQKRIVRLLDEQLESTDKIALAEVSLDRAGDKNSEWLTPDAVVSMPGGLHMKESNQHALPPLLLAIEILSPGQTFTNLRWKAEIYIQWGVEHVWFLDQEASSVLTYSAPDSTRGQLVLKGAVSLNDVLSCQRKIEMSYFLPNRNVRF